MKVLICAATVSVGPTEAITLVDAALYGGYPVNNNTRQYSPHRYLMTFRLVTEAKVFPKTITGGSSCGSGTRAAIARLVK